MEIKDFISKTLVDITEGLKSAGESTGSASRFRLTNVPLLSKGMGNDGLVEFDLAVAAEETKSSSGKAGFKIAVLEADGSRSNDVANKSYSRIKFIVEDKRS